MRKPFDEALSRARGAAVERQRLAALFGAPSEDLVSRVATAIRDSGLGPARAALLAVSEVIAEGRRDG